MQIIPYSVMIILEIDSLCNKLLACKYGSIYNDRAYDDGVIAVESITYLLSSWKDPFFEE